MALILVADPGTHIYYGDLQTVEVLSVRLQIADATGK